MNRNDTQEILLGVIIIKKNFTSKDLVLLVDEWKIFYKKDYCYGSLNNKQAEIVRRIYLYGGYDLVGTFAKLVQEPKKKLLEIARSWKNSKEWDRTGKVITNHKEIIFVMRNNIQA